MIDLRNRVIFSPVSFLRLVRWLLVSACTTLGMLTLAPAPAQAQRQMEALGRGMIVVRAATNQAYIGWRLLGDDPAGIAFNLYRSAGGGAAVKLNVSPITTSTNYLDTSANFSVSNAYHVRPVLDGIEGAPGATFTLAANAPADAWLTLPLQIPPAGTNASGAYTYTANDCSVGDLDGDGEYEIVVKWDPTNSKDNSQSGYTGVTYLDAYRLDGTRLWRIDLGVNVRSGAHYLDFMVYDFDGDGRAEVMCRTAPGSIDGQGAYVGGAAKWQGGVRPAFNDTDDYRNTSGYILQGPEFLSVFDGLHGGELATVRFFPQRDPDNLIDNPSSSRLTTLWGDGYGNRFDRFLAAVAYVDGQRPTGIFCRGYYTRTFLTAWDWRDGQLTQRWTFDSGSGPVSNRAYAGQGAHSISVGDLDGDGKDEIAYGACAFDDDGTGMWANGLGHGDATHLSEMDPDLPGLKFFMPHETPSAYGIYGTSLTEQRDGTPLWGVPGGGDVGRGVAFDVDPRYPGYEAWATNSSSIYTIKGAPIVTNTRPTVNFGVWWDADPLRELLDGTRIDKWVPASANTTRLLTMSGVSSNNGTKATPNLSGDILGDWREEVVMRAADNSALRIYTTTTPATTRLYTLMHDPQYRAAIAWQNTGYNQPPHPGYFLGHDMAAPPRAPIWHGDLVWKGATGANTWDNLASARWLRGGTASAFSGQDTVLFDHTGDTSGPVTLNGTLTPGEVVVHNAVGKDYAFAGAGVLSGPMALTKAGLGSLTLQSSHAYTGPTWVQQGDLRVDGTLSASPVVIEGLGRLSGGGALGGGLSVKARGRLAPGTPGAVATITVAGGATLADAVLELDLASTPSAASDRIAVNGNLTLTGTTRIVLNQLAGTPAPGAYPLITYTGSVVGNATNLRVSGLAGAPGTLSVSGGVVTLNVAATRAPDTVVWRGTGAAWNVNASQNWLLAGVPEVFVTGDAVRFDATGATASTVTLGEEIYPASTTVEASGNYTFSGAGAIGGPGGLTKSGTGTLTIQASNTYTGPTTINGGVVAVASLSSAGVAGPLGAASASPANLVLAGGTLRYTGTQAFSTNRGANLGAAGGAFDIAASAGNLAWAGEITGAGRLTKDGSGTLNLTGINTYAGGTLIRGGVLSLGSFDANEDGLGTGLVTLDGGTLTMSNIQSNNASAWSLHVPSGSTGRLNADGRCTLSGALTGGGDFTFHTPFTRTALNGNWSAFAGRINVVTDSDGGDFRINNNSGYAQAAIDLADKVNAYSLTGSSSFGALSGGAGAVLSGTAWTIGARNLDTIFAGTITGNSLNKVGTGRLTLTGANTYTGVTTVSAGALVVDGSLATTTVTVNAGATLGGAGTFGGSVTLQAGARLLAGPAAAPNILGSVTVAGAVTVVGNGAIGEGTYPLFTYAGSLSGAPAFTWSGAGFDATFDTTTPGVVSMTLTPDGVRPPDELVWTGAESAVWDELAVNWRLAAGGAPASFVELDAVRFDDSRAGNAAVSLAGPLNPAAVMVDNTTAYSFSSAAGGLVGPATLLKTGSGTLTLTGASGLTGAVTLRSGTLALGDEAANLAGLGTGPLILEGGTLQQFDGNGSYSATTYDLRVPAEASATFRADSRMDLSGPLTGTGTLNLYVPWLRFKVLGNWSAFAGQINVTTDADGGLFRLANTAALPLARVDLGANVSLLSFLNQNQTLAIGALSGVSSSILTGIVPDNNTPNSNTLTWQVGGLGLDTTFAGSITNGKSPSRVAFTKVGAGRLTLTGAATHTGATRVSAGTLAISGSIANTSTVEVLAGATLELTGTLSVSSVTIRAGGRLVGGGVINGTVINQGEWLADGPGVGWTVNGSASNEATGTIRLTRGAGLSISGGLNNAGTLDLITAGAGPVAVTGGGMILTDASVPTPSIATLGEAGLQVAIASHAGHVYQLQRRTDLAAGDWENVGPPQSGTGASLVFIDQPEPPLPRVFYRIVVSP